MINDEAMEAAKEAMSEVTPPPGVSRADWLAKHGSFALIAGAIAAAAPFIRAEAVSGVVRIHEPIEALMYSGRSQRLVKVCTGCGTDDGNWQRWPCPTIKALEVP